MATDWICHLQHQTLEDAGSEKRVGFILRYDNPINFSLFGLNTKKVSKCKFKENDPMTYIGCPPGPSSSARRRSHSSAAMQPDPEIACELK